MHLRLLVGIGYRWQDRHFTGVAATTQPTVSILFAKAMLGFALCWWAPLVHLNNTNPHIAVVVVVVTVSIVIVIVIVGVIRIRVIRVLLYQHKRQTDAQTHRQLSISECHVSKFLE